MSWKLICSRGGKIMVKCIGVLTSGGDAPGMNAAVRAVARTCLNKGIEVYGVRLGYKGLHEGDFIKFDRHSTRNIINLGGTMLKSARFPEFKDPEVRKAAIEQMKKVGMEALVVIGGDGSYNGALKLTEEQKYDIFAGINLSENKKNSSVNGQIIKNSGVANYILNIDEENLTQDTCLKMLQPIEEYAKFQTIYFACKALNYRFDRNKWDGPRPLSVYVDWFVDNGKLDAHLAFDNPLEHNGNEVGEKLRNILNELKIKKFDDLRGVLSPNVKCYFGK